MITVVDYGMGNLRSVRNAVAHLGKEARVSSSPEEIARSAKLILPGVGSFRRAMENIRGRGLAEPLAEAVLVRKVPVLGICLGMQLLATRGEEDGGASGLGWIPGEVVPFRFDDASARIPHVGFNAAWATAASSRVFGHLQEAADFYFVHSYAYDAPVVDDIVAQTEYGERFCSVIGRENIFGVQFHPEKSQKAGELLLRNFLSLAPR